MKLLLEIKVQVVRCQVMLQKIWKQHLYSGCQCYSLQVPVAPQKILFKWKWDRKGEGTELRIGISCNFNIVQVFVFLFLSNFEFSDGLDRLFFKSLGIDKEKFETKLGDQPPWCPMCLLCLQFLPFSVLWAQSDAAQEALQHFALDHCVHKEPQTPGFSNVHVSFWLGLLLAFAKPAVMIVLLLNFALQLEEFTLTFQGSGLILLVLKCLSFLCSHDHWFWLWSLDLGPFLAD